MKLVTLGGVHYVQTIGDAKEYKTGNSWWIA